MTNVPYKTTTYSFESRQQRAPTEQKIICVQEHEPPKLARAQTLFRSVALWWFAEERRSHLVLRHNVSSIRIESNAI